MIRNLSPEALVGLAVLGGLAFLLLLVLAFLYGKKSRSRHYSKDREQIREAFNAQLLAKTNTQQPLNDWYGGSFQGRDFAFCFSYFNFHPKSPERGRFYGLRLLLPLKRSGAQMIDLWRPQAHTVPAKTFDKAFPAKHEGAEQLSDAEKMRLWKLVEDLNGVRLIHRQSLKNTVLSDTLFADADWLLIHDWVTYPDLHDTGKVQLRLERLCEEAALLEQ